MASRAPRVYGIAAGAWHHGAAVYGIAAKSTSAPTPAHKNITDRDYFVKTVQIDGRVYDLVANVRKSADNQYVYSIQLRENKKAKAAPPRRMEKPTTLFLVKNTADIVIGFTKAGICELHDVANLTPTKFKYKTRDALSTISHNNEHLQKRSSLADTSIRDPDAKSQEVLEKRFLLPRTIGTKARRRRKAPMWTG